MGKLSLISILSPKKLSYAKIISLKPFFLKDKNKTNFVICEYSYGNNKFQSECLLPINKLGNKKTRRKLIWNKELSSPVLQEKNLHIVGDEAIGCYLSQFKEKILIMYNKTKPQKATLLEWASRKLIYFGFISFTLLNQNLIAQSKVEKQIYQEALSYYLNKKYQKSLNSIRTIFDQSKNQIPFRILAANNYIRLKEYKIAQRHCQIAIKEDPNNVEVKFFYAYLLRKQKKYSKATQVLYTIQTKSKKKKSDIHIELASIYYEWQKFKLAKKQIEYAINLEPSNHLSYYIEALIFIKNQNFEASIFRLQNALALNPTRKNDLLLIYNNLGFSLEQKGKGLERLGQKKKALEVFNKAKSYYNRALKIDTQNIIIIESIRRLSLFTKRV